MKFKLKPEFAELLSAAQVQEVNESIAQVTALRPPEEQLFAAAGLQRHLFTLQHTPDEEMDA